MRGHTLWWYITHLDTSDWESQKECADGCAVIMLSCVPLWIAAACNRPYAAGSVMLAFFLLLVGGACALDTPQTGTLKHIAGAACLAMGVALWLAGVVLLVWCPWN